MPIPQLPQRTPTIKDMMRDPKQGIAEQEAAEARTWAKARRATMPDIKGSK